MTIVHETVRPIFAHRVSLLGTENAFRIGPWIREVEQQGHRVIRCNLGEPDSEPVKKIFTASRDEIPARMLAPKKILPSTPASTPKRTWNQ